MRKLLFLLFLACNLPLFSQEYLGVNQSNYSGALGVDFNPANIVDNGAVLTNTNNRLANGQMIVVPFTGTQSLYVADGLQVSSVVEAVSTTATTGIPRLLASLTAMCS